jgi:hypothetical protein
MVTVPAQYITNTMVKCTGIPSTTSHKTWTITVTNKADRQVATSTLGYTVYHPSCYVCTDYQNCVAPNNVSQLLPKSQCFFKEYFQFLNRLYDITWLGVDYA